VNLQILNSVAFESVTGLAPPPSPISFEEYVKAGIPSMSYYIDVEKFEKIVRKFPSIKSVGEIDWQKDIKFSIRLNKAGKPVGCVVCERNLCDSLYTPSLKQLCTNICS